MTQPTFVPISEADQVRPARHLHVPGTWMQTRPAELRSPTALRGRGVGTPGPDAGFALRLAHRFTGDLRLAPGEDAHDVVEGCALLAARRAALFGRAPSIYDVQVALIVWGFLEDAATDVVDLRRRAFASVSHDYTAQRALVEGVPEESLRLSPDGARERVAGAGVLSLLGTAPGTAATGGDA
jgi:hypothetical protein